MTFRNLIVFITGILILTSLKVVEDKPNKLSDKVEVRKSLDNHRIDVFIETGTPDYELLLLNNSSKRTTYRKAIDRYVKSHHDRARENGLY